MKYNCNSCGHSVFEKDIMPIENETGMKYYFCSACIKKAVATLRMKIDATKEDKQLLKRMQKFLKQTLIN